MCKNSAIYKNGLNAGRGFREGAATVSGTPKERVSRGAL